MYIQVTFISLFLATLVHILAAGVDIGFFWTDIVIFDVTATVTMLVMPGKSNTCVPLSVRLDEYSLGSITITPTSALLTERISSISNVMTMKILTLN